MSTQPASERIPGGGGSSAGEVALAFAEDLCSTIQRRLLEEKHAC
jgi:hypothetical protein